MKNRFICSLLLILLVSPLFSPSAFSQDTVVRVAPQALLDGNDPHIVDIVNDPHIVDIVIENGQNVIGYQVMLQFNSDFLEYQKIERGDYLPTGAFFGEPKIIDMASPLKAILFAATSLTNESNGNGVLATLTFDNLKSGSTALTLLDETVLSNKVGNKSFPHLEHSETFPGTIHELVVESVQAISMNTTEARYDYAKGEKFQFRATVRNMGNVKSSQTSLIFYGPAITDTEKGSKLGEVIIGELDPQGSDELSLPDLVTVPEGSGTHYYYTVCIDSGSCYEPLKIEVDPPDLEVSISANPNTVTPGGEITLSATVKNLGRKSDWTVAWFHYRNDVLADSTTPATQERAVRIPALPQRDGTDEYMINFIATAPEDVGVYTYRVSVDSIDGEEATSNNYDSVKITVRRPDLVVESIEVDKNFLAPQERFTLNFTLKNQGSGRADAPIYYYWYRSTVPNGAREEIGEKRKAKAVLNPELRTGYEDVALIADQSLPLSTVLTAPGEPGTYSYHVCVESSQPESNTDNNCSKAVCVEIRGHPVYRPRVNVIWYHAANEKIRGPEAPIPRQFGSNYISPGNVLQNLEDVQNFFNQELGKTFEFQTSPSSSDIKVEYIQSSNFFASDVNSGAISGKVYDSDNPNHFTDNEGSAAEFLNNVWSDITTNHPNFVSSYNTSKDIYLVLIQSDHGYLGEGTDGIRGKADAIGGRIAMVSLDEIGAISNEEVKIIIAHELGHNFGFFHDFTEKGRIMSYNFEKAGLQILPFLDKNDRLFSNSLSNRSKNWLKVHPAFNTYDSCSQDTPINIAVRNASLFSHTPITLSHGSSTPMNVSPNPDSDEYKIHFDIDDLDGLHHLELIAPSLKDYNGCAEECDPDYKSLAGYLSVDASDDEAWHTFSADATDWDGEINITEWVRESREREENNFEINIATIDKAGNILYFNLSVIHTTTGAPAPLAQKHSPKETALLANYPNPFNPETWIPYQLSKSADVTLTIYDIQGCAVRTWDLGHQRAGVYQSRSRAAYWDGRNGVGEPVASGVYFYTLKAGDFQATRRMLIRK